jgi:hypothetical protein
MGERAAKLPLHDQICIYPARGRLWGKYRNNSIPGMLTRILYLGPDEAPYELLPYSIFNLEYHTSYSYPHFPDPPEGGGVYGSRRECLKENSAT